MALLLNASNIVAHSDDLALCIEREGRENLTLALPTDTHLYSYDMLVDYRERLLCEGDADGFNYVAWLIAEYDHHAKIGA
jgi:hypothetical protein